MGTQPRLPASGREATHPSILTTARDLAQSGTVGTFIDESLRRLEESFTGCLVSFNRIDLIRQTASTSLRPYRAELDRAAEGLVQLLGEHPFFAGLGASALRLIAGCASNVHSVSYTHLTLPTN